MMVCVGVCVAAVAVVGAATIAAAQQGSASGSYLNGIGDAYRLAAGGWRARLVPIAQETFMLLAALEFCVSGLVWALRRDALDDLAAKFLLKFTLISFLLTLITSFNILVSGDPQWIRGGRRAGHWAWDDEPRRDHRGRRVARLFDPQEHLAHRARP